MKLTAFYRMERKGILKWMVRDDYETKTSLYHDLKANGFRILYILSEEEVNFIKSNSLVDIPTKYTDVVIDFVKHDI
jgi:hypothetical protein